MSAPLLNFEGVTYAYPGAPGRALSDVSLQIGAGEQRPRASKCYVEASLAARRRVEKTVNRARASGGVAIRMGYDGVDVMNPRNGVIERASPDESFGDALVVIEAAVPRSDAVDGACVPQVGKGEDLRIIARASDAIQRVSDTGGAKVE